MFGRRTQGIHVRDEKNTSDSVPKAVPTPGKVVIPMSMHVGAPCTPVVKVGQEVKVGEPIGTPGGLGAPIHASVSGKVTAIQDLVMPNGATVPAVVITSDGTQTVWEGVRPPKVHDLASFTEAVKESGLVGLGGAGFPTWAKLTTGIDTLLVNGGECEPYCTTGCRTMLDSTEDLLEGARLVKQYIGAKEVIIAIEESAPKALAKMEQAVAGLEGFAVKRLPARYPQGAEKMQIFNTTGRVVPEGKLPKDVGVIVMNVASVAFIAEYLRTGMPLVTKAVTIDGPAVREPKNVIAPVGMAIGEILEAAGGCKEDPAKVIYGGPMMGGCVASLDFPLLKQNNAFLAFDEKTARMPDPTPCIRCARCVDACPMSLMPVDIAKAYELQDAQGLMDLHVDLCMECGICTYVCPAKRGLAFTNKMAKGFLREYRAKNQEVKQA